MARTAFLGHFCLGFPSSGSFLVLRNFSFLKIIRRKKKRPGVEDVSGNGSGGGGEGDPYV